MEFYLTRMGKTFFEGTVPKLVRELEKLNENLKPKEMEREISTTYAIESYLTAGWRPVLTFTDRGEEFIIVEREVRHDK